MSASSVHSRESIFPLSLRLHRVNGKRVQASAVRLGDTGLHIGSDAVALPLSAALHVAPRHASVYRDVDGWFLAPACETMILAVNGLKIPWGERHLLHVGDCVEIGLTSLVVEQDGDAESIPVPVESFALESHPAPLEDLESTELTPELCETTQQTPHENTLSDAELLHRLLSADTEESPGNQTLYYASRDPLKELLHLEDEKPEPSPGTAPSHDILTQLAEESGRVLQQPPERLTSRMPDTFAVPQPPSSVEEMPFLSSDAASLEEILHGPLSIDDVLESLRQQASEQAGINPLDAVLEQIDRVPDPLRLLAGMENPLPREPELAPVLHRAHRAVGMNTPYPSSGAHTTPRLRGSEQGEDA